MLKTFVCISLLTLGFCSCKKDDLNGFENVPEPVSPTLLKRDTAISEVVPGYYVALPSRYSQTIREYPTIIHFHGAGGYGNGGDELSRVLGGVASFFRPEAKFPPHFDVKGEKLSFIMLAPQFKPFPSHEEMKNFVDYAVASYRIERTRLYVVGLSLGAKMAGEYATTFPDDVAGLVTMGGSIVSDSSGTLESKCHKLIDAQIPVWSFHNEGDLAWPSVDSKRFISMLKDVSPTTPARLTIFTATAPDPFNHDCWSTASNPTYTENQMNIYRWLLQSRKQG